MRPSAFNGRVFFPIPMIDLTPEDIRAFQKIVFQETGQRISDEEAREQAQNLIALVSFVLKIDRTL